MFRITFLLNVIIPAAAFCKITNLMSVNMIYRKLDLRIKGYNYSVTNYYIKTTI